LSEAQNLVLDFSDKLLVIIHNFYIIGIAILELETDTPFSIDADTVLTFSISL